MDEKKKKEIEDAKAKTKAVEDDIKYSKLIKELMSFKNKIKKEKAELEIKRQVRSENRGFCRT